MKRILLTLPLVALVTASVQAQPPAKGTRWGNTIEAGYIPVCPSSISSNPTSPIDTARLNVPCNVKTNRMK